jgi:hypothetical protein
LFGSNKNYGLSSNTNKSISETRKEWADSYIKQAFEKYAIKHGISDTMSSEQLMKVVDAFDQAFEEDFQKMADAYRKGFEKDWTSWIQWKQDHENDPEYNSEDGYFATVSFYRWVDRSYPIGKYERGSKEFALQKEIEARASNEFIWTYAFLDDDDKVKEKFEDYLNHVIEMNKAKLHQNIFKHLRNFDIKSVEKLYLRRGAKDLRECSKYS